MAAFCTLDMFLAAVAIPRLAICDAIFSKELIFLFKSMNFSENQSKVQNSEPELSSICGHEAFTREIQISERNLSSSC